MNRLDLFETPLQGMNLIEASAGTGKTFAITALYLRLVVELGLPVEQILVVTYTKAATAELRERIRRRLVETRRAFEAGVVSGDSFCCQLIERSEDRELAEKRLVRAILGFDRAAVFTIHGFCQRVLVDSAFESGMPFETKLITDERELVQQVVDDFWRRHIQGLSPGILDFLLEQGVSPDYLSGLLTGRLGKPYLELRGAEMPTEIESLEQGFEEHFIRVRDCWRQEKGAIADLLRGSTGLNGNKYRKNSIDNWLLAMEAYLGEAPGPWFTDFHRFTRTTLQSSLKKGGEAPQHPFFQTCDELLEVKESLYLVYAQVRSALLLQLMEYTNAELETRKARQRVQSYDDLLLNLDQALKGSGGYRLAAGIRRSYAAALIDEFQDTDPLQYAIFREVFAQDERPLFMVGDPKQAIYSFRGADIFAYLRARQDAAAGYTLDQNWRSAPALLAGINAIFKQPHPSFFYQQIPYQGTEAADCEREPLVEEGGAAEPFRITFLEGPLNKEQALELAVDSTAAEIARLLNLSRQGRVRIAARGLSGGDIAVLVRTHFQGSRMKQALLKWGIHSVQLSPENVFHSAQAEALERLLKAVAEPGREGMIRAALASELFGLDGQRLLTMGEQELEQLFELFWEYHRFWRERGFIQLFRQLFNGQSVAARLLRFADGERRLTNLLQLGELLHKQERAERPGMEGLLKWLSRQRRSEFPEGEEQQLRLESDQELVQIVTIHKSKGLQYPIVFYPFAWDAGVRAISPGEPYGFHDPAQGFQPVLELGSEAWEADRKHAINESMAEGLRQLYVALTRAQHRCYLHWGNVGGAGQSALAWLLHPPPNWGAPDMLVEMAQGFKKLGNAGLLQRLEALVRQADGSIRVDASQVPDSPERLPVDQETGLDGLLSARSFTRRLEHNLRITSFSALTSGQAPSVELPDHDALVLMEPQLTTGAEAKDIFHFPRGARPGSCLHAIFERLDFSRHTASELQQMVEETLIAHGIDPDWTAVVSAMVQRTLATALDESGCLMLGAVSRERRLVEMGFYYPLSPVTAAGLVRFLQDQGFGRDGPISRSLRQLSFSAVQGFMKGFIDLIFEAEGRYHLLDYKSNWLGQEIKAYDQERLTSAMARDNYYLQYLFYTLALHRYLRLRLPDYDYDRHFGSVFYLFLRGMDPAAGPRYGVYRTRPEKRLIEALDRYIGQAPTS